MTQQKEISISVIIPVYKVSAYVERCLKSVIKQTYNHFECILVDDASPDDSIARCERMIAAYEGPIRFRILRHQQNRGLSAARNTGTDAATGDYILYIDSDDLISDDCVERLMAPVLRDASIEMVYGGWMRFSDQEAMELPSNFKTETREFCTREAVRDFYFEGNRQFISGAWNKLISRDFLIRHQLRFREGQLWEDILWSYFVVKYLSHLYSLPDVTYFYYDRPMSISNGTDKTERLRHSSVISEIVSQNFTPGEESREAAHFLSALCHHFIRLPRSKERCATARRFARALPFSRYPAERTLLEAACLLPHNATGKAVYKLLARHLM